MSAASTPRYACAALVDFAGSLLERSGMRADIARDVAQVLVEGDLMGHTTHGLALLGSYLDELAKGSMTPSGEPVVVSARAASELWDGGRLPGPWLTLRALERAMAMAREVGTGTVTIRRSHHIACLAAYVKRAADRGFVGIVQSSDPIVAAVVPHGGLTPVLTPNPIAAGLPTGGDPVLVDVSTSITSMGYARQEMNAGRALPGEWLVDAAGHATREPSHLFKEPKGALLPLGGLDAGYKGFALALMVEALTAGLAGHGRADPREGWGGTVFVQAIDPEAFAGGDAFRRQLDHVVALTHASQARPGEGPARVPGERAAARWQDQTAHGVALYPTIMPGLSVWAEKLSVAMPGTT